MFKKISKKNWVAGITLMFIIISLAPFANAQFIKTNIDEKAQNIYRKGESSTEIAIVYLKKYDLQNGSFIKEPLMEITIDEAERLKEELLHIEKTFNSSEEKIREQINVMHKWNILPPNIKFDDFIMALEKMKKNCYLPSHVPPILFDVIVCGPAINSFLVIGGCFYPIHLIFPELLLPIPLYHERFYLDIFNGTNISAFLGIMPVAAIICPTMTFISVLGVTLGPKMLYSPFIAVHIACFGGSISVALFTEEFPINILDWAIGISPGGLIAYISDINPINVSGTIQQNRLFV
jgi:hypothetical protein